MNNNLYKRLLEFISEERESFDMLIEADNTLGLNVTSEDIINFLEFSNDLSKNVLAGNIIITEGDILSILKLIKDLMYYEGEYTIYINDDNLGTNTYLISRANKIYKELNINVEIKIDYSDNYNSYINNLVTLYGSENFVETANIDFPNANKIIV